VVLKNRRCANSLASWVSDRRQTGQSGNLFRPERRLCGVHRFLFSEQGISLEDTRGELVTADGRVVGEHTGVHHFTVASAEV